MVDNHGRNVNYLRLAVTDRCNLRCFYCMPEEGIDYIKRSELLTYEEMVRLINALVGIGIEKLRITGGEPFLRKDMMDFLRIVSTSGLKEFHITTNGTLTYDHIPALKAMGVTSINLSLDTLDRKRFHDITRRDNFDLVMGTFHRLLEYGIKTKINMVVMNGKNTQDYHLWAKPGGQYPRLSAFYRGRCLSMVLEITSRPRVESSAIKEELRGDLSHLDFCAVKSRATATTTYQVRVPHSRHYRGRIVVLFVAHAIGSRITPQGMFAHLLILTRGVLQHKDLMRKGAFGSAIQDAVISISWGRAAYGFVRLESKR
ncbi:UNVERIFIED_CONTAM: hypothetical protein GTU68_052319 [Idotea baltica]|nr:hypothetical protein [Idotea baltica]